MNKNLVMLPCIAAIAIAISFGTKALKSNACESNSLLMANVEALSQSGDGIGTGTVVDCYNTITKEKGCSVRYCGDCLMHSGEKSLVSGSDQCVAYDL